jgi:hypothetical protein
MPWWADAGLTLQYNPMCPRVMRRASPTSGTKCPDSFKRIKAPTSAFSLHSSSMPEIHAATLWRLLRAADLQPHLWRTWKTTVWDDQAVARAIKILWYYERIEWLWQRGESCWRSMRNLTCKVGADRAELTDAVGETIYGLRCRARVLQRGILEGVSDLAALTGHGQQTGTTLLGMLTPWAWPKRCSACACP